MNTKITIIIPNYNGENLLPECLDSIKRQNFTDYDVLIVDDVSTDNSLEILKEYPFEVLVNKENLGFAGTVNRGIRHATGEYVLLLNNDVVLASDFLEKIIYQLELDPSVFSVSSKMVRYYERDLLDDTGDQYTILGWVYKRGDGDPVSMYSLPGSVFSACAGAGLYRNSYFKETGLLDELHYAYLEDVDLGWRARILGYQNVYEPNAVCFHIGSATLADGNRYSERKVELSARNNLYIIYKNMPLPQILINLPALIVGFTVKYIYFAEKGFGKSYLSGLLEGFKNLRQLKRFPYKTENKKNYFKIQCEMIENTVSYIKDKSVKLLNKFFKKKTKVETKRIKEIKG